MGLRGVLPKVKTTVADKLNDLNPPDWLGDEAKAFWLKHADWCQTNNLLSQQTAENFALCCDLWERVRSHEGPVNRLHLDTIKAYGTLARLFRLVPCDKPGTAATRHEGKEDFDF